MNIRRFQRKTFGLGFTSPLGLVPPPCFAGCAAYQGWFTQGKQALRVYHPQTSTTVDNAKLPSARALDPFFATPCGLAQKSILCPCTQVQRTAVRWAAARLAAHSPYGLLRRPRCPSPIGSVVLPSLGLLARGNRPVGPV